MEKEEIIVVCGLARCGTSLLMKMLHMGGVEPLCDPPSLGFGYEYDATLSLPANSDWMHLARGRAVKILDPHVLVVPMGYRYSFILLTRDFAEQAKSHIKFLRALGVYTSRNDRKNLERSLRRDLPKVVTLLQSYPDSKVLTLEFERVILDPLGSAAKLDDFLEREDFDVIAAAGVVMKRATKCLPYLLEAQMVA